MNHVCVVTGTRAEYGLLRRLMILLADEPDLRLSVVATGMHLAPEYGLTYTAIEADGFEIAAKVECLLSSDSSIGVAKSTGIAVMGISDVLGSLRPDAMVVLGDRFETLAAATAAFLVGIPIVHIGGGDCTAGAIDDSLRHAITKLSSLHFVATEEHRRRVVQLGEPESSVVVTGALGLDAIRTTSFVGRDQLESELGIAFGEQTAIVTFHPVTSMPGESERQFSEVLAGIDAVEGLTVIFTMPNADAEGRALASMVADYVRTHEDSATYVVSMGQARFLSAMSLADVVVGNSSSGIFEAPELNTPTVNVGERQAGRIKAESVADVSADAGAIATAIREALSPAGQGVAQRASSPYGDGHSAELMRDAILESLALGPIRKLPFHDLDTE